MMNYIKRIRSLFVHHSSFIIHPSSRPCRLPKISDACRTYLMCRKEKGMGKARWTASLVLGAWIVIGTSGLARAQDPRIAKILSYKPRQPGVVYTIPTTQQEATCKVELVTDSTGNKGNGWLLLD